MFNWTISTLERELSDGGVIVAHWRCTASDGDYSAEDAKVQAICAAVHTQDVIDAYAAHMEAQANGDV